MKTKACLRFIPLMILFSAPVQADPLGTVFTYQGRLQDGTNAANGLYDLRFAVYDSAGGNTQVGPTLTNSAVALSNGLFTVTLDFGANVFDGNARWLEAAVRTNGVGAFGLLPPRQPLTPAPYALYAPKAGIAQGVVPGGVTTAALAPGAVSQLGTPNGVDPRAVQVANNGAVGIGTTDPFAGVDIVTSPKYSALSVTYEVSTNAGGAFTNLAGANCVAAQGNLAAVGAATPGAVTLLDLSYTQPELLYVLLDGFILQRPNPSQPWFDRLYLRRVSGVALTTELLAVAASGDDAVTLFSVTNAASPIPLAMMKDGAGGFNDLAGAWAVALSGKLLAIAALTDNAVTLVDTSDPEHLQPAFVLRQGANDYTHLFQPYCVAWSGSVLAIGSFGSNAVTLVDVSVPSGPRKLAEVVQGIGGFNQLHEVTSVALAGSLLAIAAHADNAVSLVDVSQPQSPQLRAVLQEGKNGLTTLAGTRSLAVKGNLLAVGADQDNAVTLFDITDPTHPLLLSTARHGVAGAHYLDGVAGLAFAANRLAATARDDSSLTLLEWPNEPMSLVTHGWVGVGTDHPVAALDVVGSVVVENAPLFNVNANRVELGENNRAAGTDALAAGRESVSTGYGSIAAGYGATASGKAAVALGDHATAAADGAVALGTRAQALHPGSFVWADSTTGTFASSGNNQFLIRAGGGVGINKTNPATALDVSGTVQADIFHGNVQAPSLSAGILQSDSIQSSNAFLTNLRIDPNDLNSGYVTNASLTFGAGRSGEGIASKRTSGGNQNGLDFYTASQPRLSIANNGNVGIGTTNPQANLQVANGGPVETRLTSTVAGAGDWSWGTGWTGVGRPNLYLYDYLNSTTRLVVNDSGNVGIGTISPTDARLDVAGSVRINDHDLVLRGQNDWYHGLGWYGGSRPFGSAQPDGPVLYGNAGGALATTGSGNQTALSWDQNGVTVAKDLNVSGTLKVAGRTVQEHLPQVYYSQHWDFQSWGGGTTSDIARCTVPRTGPGFYLILGQATVWNTDEVWAYLYDGDQLLPLADGRFIDNDPMLPNTEFGCAISMHWVVPVTGAGPDKEFTLALFPDDDAMTESTSLVVIFFPAPTGALASASAASAAATSAATGQPDNPGSALPDFLQPSTPSRAAVPGVQRRTRSKERLDKALMERDARITELEKRMVELNALVRSLAQKVNGGGQ